MSNSINRRDLLVGAAALSGVGALRTTADAYFEPRQPGAFPDELGERSSFEQLQRIQPTQFPAGISRTPLGQLDGILTPSDLHFERHHSGIPAIDPANHALLVHGMVDRELKFALADLKRLPQTSRICMIECSGNGGVAYWRDLMKPDLSPAEIDGLTSTSEWTGVTLQTLLTETGLKSNARWLLAEGADAARMTRSIPIAGALAANAMIAYAQNGEALRPSQGYPVRLVIPGWEGNTHVKWLRRIEVGDQPFMSREETSKYTDPLADGRVRQFSLLMDAKSTITFPAYPAVLPEKGWWEIRGIAWSGRGRITKVEVSTDGGKRWQDAKLQGPVLPVCHTRFRHTWKWNGRDAVLMSRATDESGYVQPFLADLERIRGRGTLYHQNNIRPWHVSREGRVTFAVDAFE
ncbi:MAG: sulfite dehydrogenase [Gammaproteobacteria bacterium]|nr:sulfite dehydrogenase [Gammaproteobacteria bacterium]